MAESFRVLVKTRLGKYLGVNIDALSGSGKKKVKNKLQGWKVNLLLKDWHWLISLSREHQHIRWLSIALLKKIIPPKFMQQSHFFFGSWKKQLLTYWSLKGHHLNSLVSKRSNRYIFWSLRQCHPFHANRDADVSAYHPTCPSSIHMAC